MRPAVSGELESRLHVIKQEIMSRARLTELIERFDLYPDLRRRYPMDGVLDQMRHDIEIELTGPEQVSGRKTTVSFKLSYTGAQAATVADVTNAARDFLRRRTTSIRSQEATRRDRISSRRSSTRRARELDQPRSVDARLHDQPSRASCRQQVDVNLAALERLNTQLRLNGERQIKLLEDREKLADGLDRHRRRR